MQSLFQNIVSLNPLKKLIASTIQAQLSKYIEDIRLEELGLLGGNIVLENLELRKDVIQELMGIPLGFDLSRGFIKELRISIPWTRLTTKPIEIKFHTIEIIVSPTHNAPTRKRSTSNSSPKKSKNSPHKVKKAESGETEEDQEGEDKSPPSWIQSLITRVLANVSVSIEDIVFKFDDGSVVASAFLRSFSCHSADPSLGWEQRWLEPKGPYQMCHKLIQAKQLTICLDKYATDASGFPIKGPNRNVVGFERPLLDRMSLTVKMQVPLEKHPNFDLLENNGVSSKAELDLRAAEQLSSYGTGDISFDAFDSTWANIDSNQEGEAVPEFYPIYHLPFPSNCSRAIAGQLRQPQVLSPYEDLDEHWKSMEGWVEIPALPELKDSERLTSENCPIPNVVTDIFCSSLNLALSARHIVMLQHLQSLFEDNGAESDVEMDDNESVVSEVDQSEKSFSQDLPSIEVIKEEVGWFGSIFGGVAAEPEPPLPELKAAEQTDNHVVDQNHNDVGPRVSLNFMVISFHVPDMKFELLRHEEKVEDSSVMRRSTSRVDSMDMPMVVPVFGMGEVQVSGLSTKAHQTGKSKAGEKAPRPFIVFEFHGFSVDTEILSGAGLELMDIKMQLCSMSIQPADEFSADTNFSLGNISTKPSLHRSAKLHLDNHALLQCDKPPSIAVVGVSPIEEVVNGATAFEVRLIKLSNSNKSDEVASSSGMSGDVTVGECKLSWGSDIVGWIHTFMCESHVIQEQFIDETGEVYKELENEMDSTALTVTSSEEVRPPRVFYMRAKCAGFKAALMDEGVSSQFSFQDASLRYELVAANPPIGRLSRRVMEDVQVHMDMVSMSAFQEKVELEMFKCLGWRLNVKFEKGTTRAEPLKDYLLSCQVGGSFGHIDIRIDPLSAIYLGLYTRAVFNMIDVLTNVPAQSSPSSCPTVGNKDDSYQFSLVNGQCDFSLETKALSPVFNAKMSLESFQLASRRFPVIFTTAQNDRIGSKVNCFCSTSVCLRSPSTQMMGKFNKASGFTVLNNSPLSPDTLPELQIEFSMNRYEIVVDKMLCAITAVSYFMSILFSLAFTNSPPKKEQEIAITTQSPPVNIRDVIFNFNVIMEPSVVWLSSHLQFITPKVECRSSNLPTNLKFIDAHATFNRTLLVVVMQPYVNLGRTVVPEAKDARLLFEMPMSSMEVSVSHSSTPDVVSVTTRCAIDFDFDSTKIAVLSRCFLLGSTSSKSPNPPLIKDTTAEQVVETAAHSSSYDIRVVIESMSVAMFIGDVHPSVPAKIKDVPSQYIRFACYGIEAAWSHRQVLNKQTVNSYRMAVKALGSCDDLWYCPRCSNIALLLHYQLRKQKDESSLSPRLRYFQRDTSFNIIPYLDAHDNASLNIAMSSTSSFSSNPSAMSCTPSVVSSLSASWPWLCTDKDSPHGKACWFEAHAKSESNHEGSAKRPQVLVKLRRSDITIHLPTVATVASLFFCLPSSSATKAKPKRTKESTFQSLRLPSVSLEVQPLRVLVPYRRRFGENWSAVDALQWTFTMSASSQPIHDKDEIEIKALVGPMDVATVTWHRRLIRSSHEDVGSPSREGSLVLQGPVAQYFAEIGSCYIMAEERLFGNPFQFNIRLTDTVELNTTKVDIAIEASRVVVSCQPSQYTAAMSLLDVSTSAAMSISSFVTSQVTSNTIIEEEAPQVEEEDSSATSLRVVFGLSFPGVRLTVEDSNNSPLLQLRASKVGVTGSSPGTSSLSVGDLDFHCWPPTVRSKASLIADTDTGIALFGLADTSVGNTGHQDADEPLFRFDWTTEIDSHIIVDAVAQLRPVYFYATPAILDSLLEMTSEELVDGASVAVKENYPLMLMKTGVPNIQINDSRKSSFLGNMSIKVLSREVQFIFATDTEIGAAMLITIQHIFLSKTKQILTSEPTNPMAEFGKLIKKSSFQFKKGESFKERESFKEKSDEDDENEDESDSNEDEADTAYDYNTRVKVADDIMLNLVGFSVAFLNDFERSKPNLSSDASTPFHPLEEISHDDCSFKPCTVTISVRGRVVNECQPLAFLDLVVDSDEIEASFALPQLQVMFHVMDKFSYVGIPSRSGVPLGTVNHPALILPPSPSSASKRLQTLLPLDSMGRDLFLGTSNTLRSALPPNTFKFAGPRCPQDAKVQAENDHIKFLWVDPISTSESIAANSGLPSSHAVCSLGRRECLSTKDWRIASTWRYSAPRTVSRLELKQISAPKDLIASLHRRFSDKKVERVVPPAVAHLRLERQDGASGYWIAVACFSVPIDAIDAPPVTRQQMHSQPSSGSPFEQSQSSSGWEAWVGGRYSSWCRDNRNRPSHKFLIPVAQSSISWRLLWASNDISEGSESRASFTYKIFPALLFHSLEVASIEDLPLTSVRWRVRSMNMQFPSKHTSLFVQDDEKKIELNDHVKESDNEALVSLALSAVVFNVEMPSSSWIALQGPSAFMTAKMDMNFTDFATLTSATFMRGTPFFWLRGIPRGSSYFATSAISMGLGDNADIYIAPRLFHTLKLFLFEISNMWNLPQVAKKKVSEMKKECKELRYVIENFTNEPIWYGQQATAESMCIDVGGRRGYSWRSIPPAPSYDEDRKDGLGVGLSLRFALTSERQRNHLSEPSAWSEPVRIDNHELPGATTGTLSVNVIRDEAGASVCIPLFVSVRREALRVVISLRGKYCFRSSVPYPLQLRWRVVSSLVAAELSSVVSHHTTSQKQSVEALRKISEVASISYYHTTVPANSSEMFILAPAESVPRHDFALSHSLKPSLDEAFDLTLDGCCLMIQLKKSLDSVWSLPAFVSSHTGCVVVDSFSRTHQISNANAYHNDSLDSLAEPTRLASSVETVSSDLTRSPQQRTVAALSHGDEWALLTVKPLIWKGEEDTLRDQPHWVLVEIAPPVLLYNEHRDPIVVTLELKSGLKKQTDIGDSMLQDLSAPLPKPQRDEPTSPSAVDSARNRLAAKLSHVGKHVPLAEDETFTLRTPSNNKTESSVLVFRIAPGCKVAPLLDLHSCYIAKVYSAAIVGSLGLSGRAPKTAFAAMRSISKSFHVDLAGFMLVREANTSCAMLDPRSHFAHKSSRGSDPLAFIVIASSSSRVLTAKTPDEPSHSFHVLSEYFNNTSGLTQNGTLAGLDCHIGPRFLVKNHFKVPIWIHVLPSAKKSHAHYESIKTNALGYPADASVVYLAPGASCALPAPETLYATVEKKTSSHSPRAKTASSSHPSGSDYGRLFLRYGSAVKVTEDGQVCMVSDITSSSSITVGWSQVHEVKLKSDDTRSSSSSNLDKEQEVQIKQWFVATHHHVDEVRQVVLPLTVTLSTEKDLVVEPDKEDKANKTDPVKARGPATFSTLDVHRSQHSSLSKGVHCNGIVISSDGQPMFLHISPRLVLLNPSNERLRCVLQGDYVCSKRTPLWMEVPVASDDTQLYMLGLLVSHNEDDDDCNGVGSAVIEGRTASSTFTAPPITANQANQGGRLSFLLNGFRCAAAVEEQKKREVKLASQQLQMKFFGTHAPFRFSMQFTNQAMDPESSSVFDVSPDIGADKTSSMKALPERLNIQNRFLCEDGLYSTEYRIMSSSIKEHGHCYYMLTRLNTQPPMTIKNFLPSDEQKPFLEFKVDDLHTFPYRLDPRGGSAECMFDTVEPPSGGFWKPNIFRPSQMPKHTMRLRRCYEGGRAREIEADEEESEGWSSAVWVGEGVQIVSIGDVSTMIHVFYRAGCLVVLVFDPNDEGVAGGLDSLHRYAYRPYHFDVSLVMTTCAIHLLDDDRILAFETGELPPKESSGTEHGIVYSEILRGSFEGISMRMQEMVIEPRTVANGKGGLFYVPEERESHIRYIHRYSLIISDVQFQNMLAGCDLPTLVSFSPFPHSTPINTKHGNTIPPPCLSMVLEMVAVHKRGGNLPSIFIQPKREADLVLPYVKLFHLSLPRKVHVSAEETLLAHCTKLAQRCSEFEPSATVDVVNIVELPPEIVKWCEEESRPLIFMDAVTVSAMKLSVTLRVFVPGSTLFLGLDQSPFYFRSLDMKRVFASSSHLSSEVAASYAVDALLRSPALLGSLQLLGSPTALVATIAVGARDLVVLPLEALPHGPVATSRACLLGWSSFFRSLSGGALSSVSGFSSSVSRNLNSLQSVVNAEKRHRPSLNGRTPSASFDLESSFDSFRESDAEMETIELPDNDRRVKRVLGDIGRGLLGVVSVPLAPIVGAIGLVGRTTASLSSAVGGSHSLQERTRSLMPMAASPSVDPLFCPLMEELWYRTKLLPSEKRMRLLVKTPVLVDHDDMVSKSMTLIATRTKLFVFRKEAIWVQVNMSDVSINTLNGKTFFHISASSACKLKGLGFATRGLSPSHRATISEAVMKQNLGT